MTLVETGDSLLISAMKFSHIFHDIHVRDCRNPTPIQKNVCQMGSPRVEAGKNTSTVILASRKR
jgi:hypothetical protein